MEGVRTEELVVLIYTYCLNSLVERELKTSLTYYNYYTTEFVVVKRSNILILLINNQHKKTNCNNDYKIKNELLKGILRRVLTKIISS